MRLHRALYGLRQAARVCNEALYILVAALRFGKSEYNVSFYTRTETDECQTIIVPYVDDMLIVGIDESMLQKVARRIRNQVELRDEKSVTKFLGTCVDYRKGFGTLRIRNYHFIDATLDRFR